MNEKNECSWNPYSCQSLLGYGLAAHERSGCVCKYCDLGKNRQDFDTWRQFSVDHVVPTSCIGTKDWTSKFPNLSKGARKDLFLRINKINLVTACNFCNSMTSRMRIGNREAILPDREHPDAVDMNHPAVQEMLKKLEAEVADLKPKKQKYVQDRLRILKQVYIKEVKRKN